MRNTLCFIALACGASLAQAGNCIDKHANDPNFVQLTVAENAPRPADAGAFSIVDENLTIDKLSEKVGPPDGSTSSGVKTTILVWCVPDGEVRVSTRDGSTIEQVRHNGKVMFDRKKGKK
ncbi:MAG TPA: hypothetical protein VJP84_04585 [Steroidobacteraceae bacterium]|jgi:hypothetical protein|nr:hypothetical protein [Steroidobacteraceae bacterium]